MCGPIVGLVLLAAVIYVAFKVGEAFLKIGCGLFVLVMALGMLAKACS